VSSRKLYDEGAFVVHSPALEQLVPPEAHLRANPYDLNRVGVADGTAVRVTSPRGSLVTAAVADPGVPRGSAYLAVNLPGDDASALIDASEPVTDVRLESIQ
jgi:anaerobic selenocysteine-containing dehydrogenase